MNENRPDDRRMYFLLERMHSSSGAFLAALEFIAEEVNANNPDFRQEAIDLKETSSRLLVDAVNEFLIEVRARRHDTGNFQYPFESFEVYSQAAKK